MTPPGGVIVRKPGTNEPYGLIMETAFLPVPSHAEPMKPSRRSHGQAGQMLDARGGCHHGP